MQNSVVIIGGGHAGGQAAVSLRQEGFRGSITIISRENYAPYERPGLSKGFLLDQIKLDQLYLRKKNFYSDKEILLKLGENVERIIPGTGVSTNKNGLIKADSIILATGGNIKRINIPGNRLAGVHYLRTIDDAINIRKKLNSYPKVSIIGGGYIGLEIAAIARQKNCETTLIETENRLLARSVSPEISNFFKNLHYEKGVNILTNKSIISLSGKNHVQGVNLDDGSSIETNLVVVGIGITPNTELGKSCGLSINNGIVVDELTRSSVAGIYAIGDCSNHPNNIIGERLRLESVQNAIGQAKTVARVICGIEKPYAELPWFWSDQYDIKMQMAGVYSQDNKTIIRGDLKQKKFSVCYIRNGIFTGINSINAAKDFIHAKKIIPLKISPDLKKLSNFNIQIKDLL